MKKLILITAVFFALTTQAQVKKDTQNGMCYVDVQPKEIPEWLRYVTGASQVVRVYVKLTDDDLFSSATFTYRVCGLVPVDAETNRYPVISSGDFSIIGDDYLDWNANDNTHPFKVIVAILKLEIKD